MTAIWPPPSYTAVYLARQERLLAIRKNRNLLTGALEYYRTHPVEFIEHWIDTVDPRKAGTNIPARVPFILFPRQKQLVDFIYALIDAQTNGLVEKSRDMGATWLCAGVSVHLWRFYPGSSVGWGSRKQELVDRLGDMDSIFEKMRSIVEGLPREFLPRGFDRRTHMSFMKILNPETGASITGESGDSIGRGGRKLVYFKDESAHYERPERIEAALADNTNVQIDISSVNGLGNVFHRRREAGVDWNGGEIIRGRTNVFVFDWRDHPAKDQAWYEQRRAAAAADGLLHIFEQEVNRNYAASVEGVIIPAEWVKAAIDFSRLGIDEGGYAGSLDVADEGGDRNAATVRKGVVLKHAEDWGEGDVGKTTRRAIEIFRRFGDMDVMYDSVGVGAGVKAEYNRLVAERALKGLRFHGWHAGAKVLDPDAHVENHDRNTPLNKDYFANLKAQAWWSLRRRFEKTWRAVNEGISYPVGELISLPSSLPNIRQIEKELSQPTIDRSTGSLKLVVDKRPEGTKSPNIADAIVANYFPIKVGYAWENWT